MLWLAEASPRWSPRLWLGKQQSFCGAGGGPAEPGATAGVCVSAGEYVCCFEAQGFRWELYQVARVPLQAADVAQLPDQLSISCASSPGFQLSCCIPYTPLGYTASWSPAEGSEGTNGRPWLGGRGGAGRGEGSWSPQASCFYTSAAAEAAVPPGSSGSKFNTVFADRAVIFNLFHPTAHKLVPKSLWHTKKNIRYILPI